MKKKEEIITFKVDRSLLGLLKAVPNRSEFIRSALLSAFDNVCPLCSGTGIMTPSKKEHWSKFSRTHRLKKCSDCHEVALSCEKD